MNNKAASLSEFSHPLLNAPVFLREWPSWAAWAAPTKRPLDLRRSLAGASVTDADTWAGFDAALLHLRRIAPPVPYGIPVPAGVGILVAPPIVFVDFDDLFSERNEVPAWAMDFLERAAKIGAFVERSASGTGAHAFIRASPAITLKRNRYTRAHPTSTPVGIELYSQERFAAVTGIPFPDLPEARPNLNNPQDGDALLTAFLAELQVSAAPILTPDLPPAPLSVPVPNKAVLAMVPKLLTPMVARAFAEPEAAFREWSGRRAMSNLDGSLSAWRFALYMEASRASPVSPMPVYELFNPQTEPAHMGIPDWQEFSNFNAKPHRKYADIQRAHAMVVEEMRLLSLELGEAPEPETSAPAPTPAAPVLDPETTESWAQLGLVMRTGEKGTRPIASSVNFIRIIGRHSVFSKYKIERNLLDGTTMLNRQPIRDTEATRFLEPLRAILDLPKDPPIEAVRDAIEVIADDNPYDPLLEYLHHLPKFNPAGYDPETSLLSNWLARVGAAPSSDLQKFSRRILLGLVARALKPGVKFDYVPVFEGPQGVGKSTLVKALVGGDFYATLFGGLHSKDALMTLRGKWAIEISELAAFKKTDNETMKSFFSTMVDTFRPPYGRAMVNIPRRTVLFGTTNDSQYLTDHTGARRFWPIYFPKAIDIKWLEENRDALFAEALHFYQAGEQFHDTLEELLTEGRQRALSKRLVTPAWQQKLLANLTSRPTPHLPSGEGTGFSGILTPLHVAALQPVLELPQSLQFMSQAQLAAFLQRAGYVKMRLSYRPVGGESGPTRLYAHAHPALTRLTPEQLRAFLSHFPDLFVGKIPPPTWVMLQPEHTEGALHALKSAPQLLPQLDVMDDDE